MASTIITKYGSGAPLASDVVRGELAVDTENKRLYTENSGGSVVELGTNPAADVTFGDNVKAVFGAGSDLQIYHDASDSIINDNGTGSLKLQQGGSTKLEVTATGIDVTGTVTSDGLTVDGNAQFNIGAAGIAEFYHTSGYGGIKTTGAATSSGATIYLSNDKTGTPFDIYTIFADGSNDSLQFWSGGNPLSGTKRFNAASNGDISFYEDTGTTAKLFWDASAESLGIGTTTPNTPLQVSGANSSTNADALFSVQKTTEGYGLFSGVLATGVSWLQGGTSDDLTYYNLALQPNGGNVGIGITSPGVKLHVEGDTNSNVMVVNNIGTAPNYIFDVRDDGVSQFRVDPNGNVGIGLAGASPTHKLEIRNDVLATTDLDPTAIKLFNNDDGGSAIEFSNGVAAKSKISFGVEGTGSSTDDTYFAFSTSANGGALSEAMRIDSSGNVGIGVSPAKTLDVRTSSGSDAVIRVGSSSSIGINVNVGAIEFYSADADDAGVKASIANYVTGNEGPGGAVDGNLIFSTTDSDGGGNDSPTERMRIDSNGNVGIGTSSPVNNLQLSASAYASVPAAGATGHMFAFGSSAYGIAGGSLLNGNSYLQSTRWDATATNYDLLLQPNGGNLLVGQSTSTSPGAGNTTTGFSLKADGQFFASSPSGDDHVFNINGTGNIISIRTSGTQVGTISVTGSATAYNTSSDQRLKDNIVDAPSASDDIDAIQVRSFDWKVNGSHQKYGMVAQELVTVAPEAVHQPEDPEEMMGVDYSKLVPMMLKEIQSLRARVAQLEGAN